MRLCWQAALDSVLAQRTGCCLRNNKPRHIWNRVTAVARCRTRQSNLPTLRSTGPRSRLTGPLHLVRGSHFMACYHAPAQQPDLPAWRLRVLRGAHRASPSCALWLTGHLAHKRYSSP